MAYRNPAAREWHIVRPQGVRLVHTGIPGYAPARLVPLPDVATELGIASVHVKEECSRFGLPAFKMLGASYAILRALSGGQDVSFDELSRRGAGQVPKLVAATDGNHGRAVARVASLLGARAEIFVPADITRADIDAISEEGAQVTELAQPYDGVVAAAAEHADSTGALLVQDTAWEGHEEIPGWIVEGYSTLFDEADEQLAEGGVVPDLVVVPIGVGSLAGAAVRRYRSGSHAPSVLGVGPEAAPAVLAPLETGRVTSVPAGRTDMAGLNCGTPPFGSWPTLENGLDIALSVSVHETIRAVHDLAALGVDAGPTGPVSAIDSRTSEERRGRRSRVRRRMNRPRRRRRRCRTARTAGRGRPCR